MPATGWSRGLHTFPAMVGVAGRCPAFHYEHRVVQPMPATGWSGNLDIKATLVSVAGRCQARRGEHHVLCSPWPPLVGAGGCILAAPEHAVPHAIFRPRQGKPQEQQQCWPTARLRNLLWGAAACPQAGSRPGALMASAWALLSGPPHGRTLSFGLLPLPTGWQPARRADCHSVDVPGPHGRGWVPGKHTQADGGGGQVGARACVPVARA